MKVSVMIVDTVNEITQYGTIEEPIRKGFEVANALGHFGVNINSVAWNSDFSHMDVPNKPRLMTGCVTGTSKVVNVIAYENNRESKSSKGRDSDL